MLQRSPKSKFFMVSSSIFALIAVVIFLDSLLSLKNLESKYGQRSTYLIAMRDIGLGEIVVKDAVREHEMFVVDSPPNAINAKDFDGDKVALSSIKTGTIITSETIGDSAQYALESDERIVFIPTQEKIDSSIAEYSDVISFAPDDFGASTIASKAKLLFDHGTTSESQDSNQGYWVIVTKDEALDISKALSTGDIKLALVSD